MARLRPSVRPSALSVCVFIYKYTQQAACCTHDIAALSLTAFRENSSRGAQKHPSTPPSRPAFLPLSVSGRLWLFSIRRLLLGDSRILSPFIRMRLYLAARIESREVDARARDEETRRARGVLDEASPSRSSHCPERRFASRKERTSRRTTPNEES